MGHVSNLKILRFRSRSRFRVRAHLSGGEKEKENTDRQILEYKISASEFRIYDSRIWGSDFMTKGQCSTGVLGFRI